jgi:hypothetical protein
MNDQELRQIVRQAIARQMAVQGPGASVQSPSSSVVHASPPSYVPETVPFGDHASHAMYLQLVNTTTACVIEEHVSCDHCGYCKSHGH